MGNQTELMDPIGFQCMEKTRTMEVNGVP